MEDFVARRKAALARYKLEYEMKHEIVEEDIASGEDEID